jgi:hypothetical protein
MSLPRSRGVRRRSTAGRARELDRDLAAERFVFRERDDAQETKLRLD